MLNPIRKYFFFNGIREEYGVTKETGATFAMIQYALPGLMPKNVRKMKELESSILSYDNPSELLSIINHLVNKPYELDMLKAMAFENSSKFLPENIRNKFISTIGLG